MKKKKSNGIENQEELQFDLIPIQCYPEVEWYSHLYPDTKGLNMTLTFEQ